MRKLIASIALGLAVLGFAGGAVSTLKVLAAVSAPRTLSSLPAKNCGIEPE